MYRYKDELLQGGTVLANKMMIADEDEIQITVANAKTDTMKQSKKEG